LDVLSGVFGDARTEIMGVIFGPNCDEENLKK